MKRIVLLLLALSVFCVAKPADESTDAQALPEEESLRDSTITVYIHPLNFMVPYSHFWGGINVPNGITDYPQFFLTLEWKLMEKISLISTPHFVRVDRTEDDDGYKIYDIGLQESFRLYGVGGKRWLLHLSAMPTLIVVNRNNITVDGERRKVGYHFPEMIFNEHMAIVYNISPRYFLATTVVFSISTYRSSAVQIIQNKWRSRACLGIRF